MVACLVPEVIVHSGVVVGWAGYVGLCYSWLIFDLRVGWWMVGKLNDCSFGHIGRFFDKGAHFGSSAPYPKHFVVHTDLVKPIKSYN